MIIQKDNAVKTEHLARVVNEIGTQVDRASEIIRRLMTFGNKPGFSKQPTDVNKAVQEALLVVKNQLKIETKL